MPGPTERVAFITQELESSPTLAVTFASIGKLVRIPDITRNGGPGPADGGVARYLSG